MLCSLNRADRVNLAGKALKVKEMVFVQLAKADRRGNEKKILLHEEVEKRYLAYALSTIVSRALPDVRDGLKPVHRRILYAMNSMGLSDAAKMRKSAAVVGEVIGKYHPHGDQAAYEALARMAQDFSLRYPLIDGSGNFGSVDGDSPAAMRYTEARLSAFAGALMREINEGTTAFRPTYDGMGVEPDVLPAGVPNLLLNGSSGIAVGMTCSFPPHNAAEVLAACRAVIRDKNIGATGLLHYVKGPDFPTGGEILDQFETLAEIYESGHGSIRVRGTFEVEQRPRGAPNLIVTSVPYSVNKSRLIERIAQLIKEKRLRQVQDIRDESTQDVRIVLELRGSDVKPESVMAFLYKHTDLQINFPVNLIAITPQGVPERLSLGQIIRYFTDFRYEKTTLRLKHRLELLEQRIHILAGFDLIFQDMEEALRIIRSARNREQAEQGLKSHFGLSDKQVDSILEMRLYRLVALEMGKLMDELAAKKREAREISQDLASPERLWKIVDRDLEDAAKKFGDPRRTRLVGAKEASAIEFNPAEFVEHEDVTVILSKQGWIRRIKTEVGEVSSLKFREGDGPLGLARVNTERTVGLFSSLGKVYVMRALDIPATSGFGEPVGTLLNLADGEFMVGFIVPHPVKESAPAREDRNDEDENGAKGDNQHGEREQPLLFRELDEPATETQPIDEPLVSRGILVTRGGKGFQFELEILYEPTKRIGRKLVNLAREDAVVTVRESDRKEVAIAASSGHMVAFPVEQVPVLAGPAGGVRMIKLIHEAHVIALETVGPGDFLAIEQQAGKVEILAEKDVARFNRGARGKRYCDGMARMQRQAQVESEVQ